ncbi:hypothetical protein MHM98_00330 [Psychrobium sp. MM17-31]|uniref:hypothetical protein n=1 Tax=Psychrobium sp. MM17-31 TaxID=2917758 RepID=UPI001EF6002D|nr:hypothetical protein [Psychrobium sp. MM17-31]MCG7529816.1 hypothetical protein [Psychrobium sp. MM17-31]
MRLSLSIVTTVIIAALVWLIMLWQPEDSWSDEYADYQTIMTQVAADYGYETATENEETNDATTATVAQTIEHQSNETESSKSRHIEVSPSTAHQAATMANTTEIVGITRSIELQNINALWQEFGNISHLERALITSKFSIYAVYSEFNATYSQATVTIGYDRAALNDSAGISQRLPTGKKHMLLPQGHYSNFAIVDAWQGIDYRRGLVAVVEQRHFDGDIETVSLWAIYQE